MLQFISPELLNTLSIKVQRLLQVSVLQIDWLLNPKLTFEGSQR